MEGYQPGKIEKKWQKIWQKTGIYQPDLKKAKKPFYNLMMFPYPSAEGLHVGNVYAFTGSDIYGRFKRMQGFDVFEPIGLDGFGIHSENYALKVGRHPAKQAKISEKNFYRQLSQIGNSFAWENRLETYDPSYYRFTQWIFVQMFKAGLAYRKKSAVNFCPSCKTVLADEQVVGGRCERCKTPVEQRRLEQWFFRITAYAERLLKNLDRLKEGVYGKDQRLSEKEKTCGIDWSEKVKIAQRNWIGRSEGAEIKFPICEKVGEVGRGEAPSIRVFTTRPDTIFGATFLVLSPQHWLVEKILSGAPEVSRAFHLPGGTGITPRKKKEVEEYVERVKKKTEVERAEPQKEKTGVFTGLYCLNPATREKIPIFVADYVTVEYGTGAIMGVPAHDQRDFEFAKKYNLPIKVVVRPECLRDGERKLDKAFEDYGVLVNSAQFSGLKSKKGGEKIVAWLAKKGLAKKAVRYKLRDWCISRQRYWGPPIPMIYCSRCAKEGITWWETEEGKVFLKKLQCSKTPNWQNFCQGLAGWFPVSEDKLPVLLPLVEDWRPKGKGKGPLDKIPSFYKVKCPNCGGWAKRETDVSDTFLDSAWYFLRYPSIGISKVTPHPAVPIGIHPRSGKEKIPWNPEITKKWLPVDMYIGGAEHSVLHLLYSRFLTMVFKDLGFLDFEEPFRRFRAHGLLISEGAKMSKSRGNVVVPDQYIKKYGADTLRMYLMFLGPFSQGGDFRDTGIRGIYRFLGKVWRLVEEEGDRSTPGRVGIVPPPRWQAGALAEAMTPRTVGRSKDDSQNQESNERDSLRLKRLTHQTIKKVTEDIKKLSYNTAIAHLMEYVNKIKTPACWQAGQKSKIKNEEKKEAIKTLLLLLAPFAPHITEELWEKIGERFSIHTYPWPKFDPNLIKEEETIIAIEVDGRVRGEIKIKTPACWQAGQKSKIKNEVEKLAKKEPKVKKYLAGKKIKRVVFVPARLINFVTQ